MSLHPTVTAVTERIVARSAHSRATYLERIRAAGDRVPKRGQLACANLAHGFAASDAPAKQALRGRTKPNLAIVSAYNDMLSAHQPYRDVPEALKKAVIRAGGIAQFAGGVPAMCDGITQGRDGMQLSLYSRDVIAMSTAIALSHDMFDCALMLGVCDKIVPGLLIGALSFGHLPTALVPAFPHDQVQILDDAGDSIAVDRNEVVLAEQPEGAKADGEKKNHALEQRLPQRLDVEHEEQIADRAEHERAEDRADRAARAAAGSRTAASPSVRQQLEHDGHQREEEPGAEPGFSRPVEADDGRQGDGNLGVVGAGRTEVHLVGRCCGERSHPRSRSSARLRPR